MSAKGKYHLVPEDAARRASIESIDTDASQPLIHASRSPSPAPRDPKDGFKTLHPTFWLRLLASIFLFTGLLLLAINARQHAVPSVVFLSIAAARNLFVILKYLLTKCVNMNISLHVDGKSAARTVPKWMKSRQLSLIIDFSILLALVIVLSVGVSHRNSRYYYYNSYSRVQMDGFAVALTALPFYFIGSLDCGTPSSIAIVAQLNINGKNARCSRSIDRPSGPEVYRDVEAQLPVQTEEVATRDTGDLYLP